jgi:hypothetical protein
MLPSLTAHSPDIAGPGPRVALRHTGSCKQSAWPAINSHIILTNESNTDFIVARQNVNKLSLCYFTDMLMDSDSLGVPSVNGGI